MSYIKMKLSKIDIFGTKYTIKYVDKITKDLISDPDLQKEDSFWFGLTNGPEKEIYIATKGMKGSPLTEEEIYNTLLHEVIHAIFGEGAYSSANNDEPLVEWTAKCLRSLTKQGLFK